MSDFTTGQIIREAMEQRAREEADGTVARRIAVQDAIRKAVWKRRRRFMLVVVLAGLCSWLWFTQPI